MRPAEAGDLLAQYGSNVADLLYDGTELGYVLAQKNQGFPHFTQRYAAALSLEGCQSLKLALDISQNLNCYDWMQRADLEEELELTQVFLEPPQEEMIRRLMLERTPRGDVRRAADYFKLVRYSFSGGANAFAGRPCDLRRFFYLVWECSRRLKDVVVENKDFGELIAQYDREDTFFYCDPPYFNAECYEVAFPKTDHIRLHDTLAQCKGLVMVSYNYCGFICDLYRDFYIFHTTRPNSMSQTAGSEYEEVVMTNYDPRALGADRGWQISLFQRGEDRGGGGMYQLIHEPIKNEEEHEHEGS